MGTDDPTLNPLGGSGKIIPFGGGEAAPIVPKSADSIPDQGGSTIEQSDDLDKVIVPGELPLFQIPNLIQPKMTAEELQKQYPQLVEFLKTINVSAEQFLKGDSFSQYMVLFMHDIIMDMWAQYDEALDENIEKSTEAWQRHISEMAGLKYDAFRDELNSVSVLLLQFQMDRASLRTAEQAKKFEETGRAISPENIAVASLVAQVKFTFASPTFNKDLLSIATGRVEKKLGRKLDELSDVERAQEMRKVFTWIRSAKVQVLFHALGLVLQVPGIANAQVAVEKVLTSDHEHQDIELLRTMLAAELSELTALLGPEAATKMFYDMGSEMARAPRPDGLIKATSDFLRMISGEDSDTSAYHSV